MHGMRYEQNSNGYSHVPNVFGVQRYDWINLDTARCKVSGKSKMAAISRKWVWKNVYLSFVDEIMESTVAMVAPLLLNSRKLSSDNIERIFSLHLSCSYPALLKATKILLFLLYIYDFCSGVRVGSVRTPVGKQRMLIMLVG